MTNKYNKIKQMLSYHKLETAMQEEENHLKSRYKGQRLTFSHGQYSHKNTNLKAIIQSQKIQYRPVQALCFPLKISVNSCDFAQLILLLALKNLSISSTGNSLSSVGMALMETSHLFQDLSLFTHCTAIGLQICFHLLMEGSSLMIATKH